MSNTPLDHSALKDCLDGLNHLFIDIGRLKPEPGYEDRRGGYCDLQVATLDSEIPSASKLVAAKKLLLGTRSNEPKRLAFRLARELKVWAGLCHPHVLPLLGFYLDDNFKTAVLISEYMVHGDLKDYITKMTPSYDERLHLVRDLTDGLAYLHTQTAPVRHGDLKPGNVLVNLQRRALLADFGLSKALNSGPTGFTTGNDARGTVRFSGPEVLLLGVAAESLANDIWSWGCLVLEAMTDQVPFGDIQPEAQLIVALIQDRTPSDMRSLAINLPQFSDLLTKCWSREPNQRPTAVDCLGVIQSALPHSAPASITRRTAEQLTHSLATQQQTPIPPSTQPSQTPQASAQVHQQPLPGPPPNKTAQFHDFFKTVFNNWLTERQVQLDPPRVEEKEVELHKLFLMVVVLGGCRAVSEKKLWRVVGAKTGLPDFDGPVPYSKPEVADQLSEIYERTLADFEPHWHSSLRPHDPNPIFPLPPQLQYLHPSIERLAATLLPLQQQRQSPMEGRLQQPLNDQATGPTCDQVIQEIFQMSHTDAAVQKQEDIIEYQSGLAFAQQAGLLDQGKPMAWGRTSLPQRQSSLLQHVDELETPNQSPEARGIKGLSDPVIPFTKFQKLMLYRHHILVKQIRPEELRGQHATGPLNRRSATSQMALRDRLPLGLRLPIESEPDTTAELPPKPRPTTPTTEIPQAEAPSTRRHELKIMSTKRAREDDVTGPDGSAGPSDSLKRARMDSQQDLGSECTANLVAGEQLKIGGSLESVERRFKGKERVATAVAPVMASENGVAEQNAAVMAWEDLSFGETPDLAHSVSTEGPTPDAEGPEFWAKIGISDGWHGWDALKPEWDPVSIGRWLIGDPSM